MASLIGTAPNQVPTNGDLGTMAFQDNKSVVIEGGQATFTGDVQLATKTPSSASDTGTAGTIAWDADYIYICTATDTWKRVAISTW